jgi:anti-sigma B factor antagonist
MEICKQAEGEKLTITLKGRLDTMTSPELEEALKESLEKVKELVFDFTDVEYISSAGLRVLLGSQKAMGENGKMIIRHVNEPVMEVFEVTGFTNVFTIE